MPKPCDNKSVGVLVWKNGKLLLIERKQYNPGFALPAGHQDGDTPFAAAQKELSEEVGLNAVKLEEKLFLSLPNPCLKRGGKYHDWTIFEAAEWSGEVKPSADETKSYLWASREEIKKTAKRLEEFAAKEKIPLTIEELPQIVDATNQTESWWKNPGLEPPMYFLFKKLKLI